jgi:dTDP-4-amino-4,6-dideoxygalactose transaminase
MDALQAAVLRVKLPHLARWTARRQENAATYRELFEREGLSGGAAAPVVLPSDPATGSHVYHQFVIRARDRDALRAHLTTCEVGTEVYYPVPFHRQPCFAGLPAPVGGCPEADAAAADVLALPIYPELTRAHQEHVVTSIARFYA